MARLEAKFVQRARASGKVSEQLGDLVIRPSAVIGGAFIPNLVTALPTMTCNGSSGPSKTCSGKTSGLTDAAVGHSLQSVGEAPEAEHPRTPNLVVFDKASPGCEDSEDLDDDLDL